MPRYFRFDDIHFQKHAGSQNYIKAKYWLEAGKLTDGLNTSFTMGMLKARNDACEPVAPDRVILGCEHWKHGDGLIEAIDDIHDKVGQAAFVAPADLFHKDRKQRNT